MKKWIALSSILLLAATLSSPDRVHPYLQGPP